MKEAYIPAELRIVTLTASDVITTSLPFMPNPSSSGSGFSIGRAAAVPSAYGEEE